MNRKELLKQLNSLKESVKPDEQWQSANRDILCSQIKAQTQLDLKKDNTMKIIPSLIFNRVSLRSAVSMVVVILIVLGSWGATVSATKRSLPGDLLYTFKLTSERVHVNLTFDDEKKTNLEMEFAQRRLEEIKVLVLNTDNNEENAENLEVSLQKFQENIDNVKSNLSKLEQSDKGAAVKIAAMIDEKTTEYVELLEDQQGDTAGAISASKSTGDKALTLIITEFEFSESEYSREQVQEKVQSRINTLNDYLVLAQNNIEEIKNNKIKVEAEAKIAAEKAEAEEKIAAEKAEEEEKIAAEKAEEEEKIAAEKAEEEEANNEESTEEATELDESEEVNNEEGTEEATEADEGDAEENLNSEEEVTNDEDAQEVQEEEVVIPEDLPSLDEVKDRIPEVKQLITEAQDLLNGASISQAFDKIKQANKIMNLINKVVGANSEYLYDKEDSSDNQPIDDPVVDEEADDESVEENTDTEE